MAETGCRYLKEIAYPDPVTIGVGVLTLGRSSVRYGVGVGRDRHPLRDRVCALAAVGQEVEVDGGN